MTKRGIFHTLTPEQQAAALAYDGPEAHGDPAFAINRLTESDRQSLKIATERAWADAWRVMEGREPKFGRINKDEPDGG